MKNYTKYKLKNREELMNVLQNTDNVFVVSCKKCFNEFTTTQETDSADIIQIAKELNKKVTGNVEVDFLCNATLTEKKLNNLIPKETQSVIVASCGLGIQTVAGMLDMPVLAAADSIHYNGHHGMALTEKTCGACAQCYLNITGGICPVVDCAKGLLNGQCGGAKNGKCEVDPNKSCAWEKIQNRLSGQNDVASLTSQPVQLRDYSKVNFKLVQEYVKSIRENRFAGYYGGLHPVEGKEASEHKSLVRFDAPNVAVFPLSMHLGALANPIVSVGDYVRVGQKIAEASGPISAPVHSSISGTVVAIENRPHATRGTCLSVVVESDGKNAICESVKPNKPLDVLTPAEIIEIVKEAGIVGMGGAGFPTYVKLNPGKPIEAVLINGCECEPMLTADHRVALEYADDVIYGLKAVMKAVNCDRGVIVIEDNKPDAIALLEQKTAEENGIEVCTAKTKYPQGGEKMLIQRVLGRMVPSGKLPADVGAVVCNISTVKAISDAIQKGLPLIERVTTVTGPYIPNPTNFIVKIGTNAADLVTACGGIMQGDVTIKAGGPMMGFVQENLDFPIMKGSNGIIAVKTEHSAEQSCIKCGRCVDICPMQLQPLHFAKFVDDENWEGLRSLNILDCMECRCCETICSSRIPLVSKIKAGKNVVRGMK